MWRILVLAALFVLASANFAMMAVNAQDLVDETPTPVEVHGLDGNLFDHVIVGQQVILSATFENDRHVSQPYVAMFEVRDSDGFTVYLTWQTGIMAASGQANVGVSWIAESIGEHQIRTFLLSSLTNPEILDTIDQRSLVVQNAGA
jgi:hypothetical protein